jgi:uncharacterized membrane protein YgaE (UPF0421/DUF939 family)
MSERVDVTITKAIQRIVGTSLGAVIGELGMRTSSQHCT